MQYLPFYIWIKCMILKMITLCPKVLGKFSKKEHQNVIETRKFSGWESSGGNGWMVNVLICLSNNFIVEVINLWPLIIMFFAWCFTYYVYVFCNLLRVFEVQRTILVLFLNHKMCCFNFSISRLIIPPRDRIKFNSHL